MNYCMYADNLVMLAEEQVDHRYRKEIQLGFQIQALRTKSGNAEN